MALLITPTQWTRQPQVPIRTGGSVIAQGIRFAHTPIAPLFNLAGTPLNIGIAKSGANPPTTVPKQAGLADFQSGASPGGYTLTMPTWPTSAGTILIIQRNTGTGNAVQPFALNTSENEFLPFTNNAIYTNAWATARWLSAVAWPGGSTAQTVPFVYAVRGSNVASSHAAYLNGVKLGSANATWLAPQTSTLLNYGTFSADGGVKELYLCLIWDRALNDSELAWITANPSNAWQTFEPLQRRIWVGASSSTPTGTLAYTNANDTLAGVGAQTNTGTLATTNANDTSAGSGTQTNTGTLARANANDTLAGAGAQTNTGTLAYSNANDTLAAVGFLATTGTLATTNANDTLAATGSGGDLIDSFYDRPSKRKEKFNQKREERDDRLQDILQMFEAKMEPPKIAPIVVKPVAKPAFDYERDDEETLMALL